MITANASKSSQTRIEKWKSVSMDKQKQILYFSSKNKLRDRKRASSGCGPFLWEEVKSSLYADYSDLYARGRLAHDAGKKGKLVGWCLEK
jgi:hypothetical protein